MTARMRTWLRPVVGALVSRGVSRESLAVAAGIVSVAAGFAVAAGGAAREPRLWLLVPLLGLARLFLDALTEDLEG